jgi:hypothetical protein
MNLLAELEPVLALSVLDVPFLLDVDEPPVSPVLVAPLLSLSFFTANAEVTKPLLDDAVTRDIAVTTAKIANAVVTIFFVCIKLATELFIKWIA